MRKKIIGAAVFIILTLPVISAIGTTQTLKENLTFEENLDIVLYQAPGFIGVNLDISNIGSTTLNNIEWSFRSKAAITGTGIFMSEKLQQGIIDEIAPGETITIEFRPLNPENKSPIGLGNLYMNASAKADGISVRTQQRAIIFGFFMIMFKDTYMDIKPEEAYERWQNEEFDLIIDVVGLDIYNLGHLPGAVNYVWADGTLNSKIPELDPSLTYLVYCHTDPPSTASAQALVNAGFEHVYRLEGNYAAWKNAGYPVET
jgi:rhodanese-related sulfurtransferase